MAACRAREIPRLYPLWARPFQPTHSQPHLLFHRAVSKPCRLCQCAAHTHRPVAGLAIQHSQFDSDRALYQKSSLFPRRRWPVCMAVLIQHLLNIAPIIFYSCHFTITFLGSKYLGKEFDSPGRRKLYPCSLRFVNCPAIECARKSCQKGHSREGGCDMSAG